jgi:hypothetical protein
VKRDWTKRSRLDDYRRNARRQAVRRSICNAPGCVCLVAGLAVFANVYVGSAQAAGGSAPVDLSTQIQGIVDSAMSAQQPLNDSATTQAQDVANQAVALAENVAADATSTAGPLVAQSAAELPPGVEPAPAPAGSARERTAPALQRKHRPAAVPPPRTRGVVSSVSYDRSSPSAVGPSPIVRARTAKAPPRPERSAAPRWPRPAGPMPPRPDASSPGQGGGQGTSVPLLLAALTGLLFIFGFHRLPRLLPLLAFRKPRRIVLPSWHPG